MGIVLYSGSTDFNLHTNKTGGFSNVNSLA